MSHRKKTIEIPDKLVEGWEKVEKAIDENATMLSERTYSLSAGGLALSFTIISFIIGGNKACIGIQAPLIWFGFLICILADTGSIVYAKKRAEKLELDFRKRVNNGEKMTDTEVNRIIDSENKRICLFNTIVFSFLIAVIIWAVIYCFSLLNKLS